MRTSQSASHRVATTDLVIRTAIEAYRPWIESQLSVALSDTIVIETELNLSQVATERVLGCEDHNGATMRHVRRLRSLLSEATIPEGIAPLLGFEKREVLNLGNGVQGGLTRSVNGLVWRDCPVAFRLLTVPSPVIALNVTLHQGLASSHESTAHLLIARRDCTERIVRLLGELTSSSRQPLLHTINGSVRNVVRCDWEQLVLSPDVVSLLKNDFESFFRRESWYLEKGVPFRRGYLLHGAPGNGKSSAIRAMLSGQGLTAYTLRFFDPHVDDADLEHLFDRALRERPSMILLEDIDRAFPRTSESKTGISLQALLNALDGVGSGQGIVVVATANEPTLLDPAILKRPGRFDRVVHFGNPDESLRHKFFSRFMPELSAVELTETVSITSGFSFAQLREVFVLAGQFAFERDAKMESGDLCRAAISLRDSSSAASRSQFAAGFISC